MVVNAVAGEQDGDVRRGDDVPLVKRTKLGHFEKTYKSNNRIIECIDAPTPPSLLRLCTRTIQRHGISVLLPSTKHREKSMTALASAWLHLPPLVATEIARALPAYEWALVDHACRSFINTCGEVAYDWTSADERKWVYMRWNHVHRTPIPTEPSAMAELVYRIFGGSCETSDTCLSSSLICASISVGLRARLTRFGELLHDLSIQRTLISTDYRMFIAQRDTGTVVGDNKLGDDDTASEQVPPAYDHSLLVVNDIAPNTLCENLPQYTAAIRHLVLEHLHLTTVDVVALDTHFSNTALTSLAYIRSYDPLYDESFQDMTTAARMLLDFVLAHRHLEHVRLSGAFLERIEEATRMMCDLILKPGLRTLVLSLPGSSHANGVVQRMSLALADHSNHQSSCLETLMITDSRLNDDMFMPLYTLMNALDRLPNLHTVVFDDCRLKPVWISSLIRRAWCSSWQRWERVVAAGNLTPTVFRMALACESLEEIQTMMVIALQMDLNKFGGRPRSMFGMMEVHLENGSVLRFVTWESGYPMTVMEVYFYPWHARTSVSELMGFDER